MLSYLYTIFNSNYSGFRIIKVLIVLAILLAFVIMARKSRTEYLGLEGFTQKEPFVLKENSAIYDDFYCQIHDEIHQPEQRRDFELMTMVKSTQPSKQSVMLDVGSGTGHLVNELREAGYKAYGIDKSEAMVSYSEKKYPKSEYRCENAVEPMAFEKSTFSHILCTYFTIYEIKDRPTFFRNCFFWLQPGGYLILHLVDPHHFDAIAPIGKRALKENPQRFSKKRITDTLVDFPDYEYKSSFQFKEKENLGILKETFKDKSTQNVRQNEQVLQMDSIKTILKEAQENGFILHSQADMVSCIDDENQFLYILERIQGNL